MSSLTSLSFRFPNCKTGIIMRPTRTVLVSREDEITMKGTGPGRWERPQPQATNLLLAPQQGHQPWDSLAGLSRQQRRLSNSKQPWQG